MSERASARDIVAIGASAGGIEAVSKLLRALPGDLPAAVIVVLHRSPEHRDHLLAVMQRATSLKVMPPRNGEMLRRGVCYVPFSDQHFTLGANGEIRVWPNGYYRAHNIDALFCSLAVNAPKRSIGVVLSGILMDGSFGLRMLKDAGGCALVQDPDEAGFSDMPLSALRNDGSIDFVGPVDALARRICELTGGRAIGAALTD